MKAITLTQPWATLMAIGVKQIETRSWKTTYRGWLAIHAARGFPKWARDFTLDPICYEAVRYHRANHSSQQRPADLLVGYPLGAVLAIGRLVNVLPTEVVDCADNIFSVSLQPISDRERAFGDYGFRLLGDAKQALQDAYGWSA